MEHQHHGESVQFGDARVIADTGLRWLGVIDGQQVTAPPLPVSSELV
jgi:hypothetical protein